MKKRLLIVWMLCCWLLPVRAQQMWVEDFARLKHHADDRSKVVVDKQYALIDMVTQQKGFSFAVGQQPAEAVEGDGMVTVKIPDKTKYLIIKHPDYGLYTWRVPIKYLKRKNHYRATLQTIDQSKEYKMPWQWVVFDVSPNNAILHIDSAIYFLRQGSKVLRLPVGKHGYLVESPFYEAVSDSLDLTDTAKVRLDIRLQPIYSYLTVKTPWRKGRILVDDQLIGEQECTSFRLNEGRHTLSVYCRDTCCYYAFFDIGRSEKRVITLTEADYYPQVGKRLKPVAVIAQPQDTTATTGKDSVAAQTLVKAPVTLTAADDSTEIWLNCEKVGAGKWQGTLTEGFYMVTTRKNGLESEPTWLWINDDFPQEVNLAVPETSHGMLNVYSNVIGAEIYVNEVLMGETPCVIQGLLPSRNYDIRLHKTGYKDEQQMVRPRSNDVLDMYIKMKVKK
jgi:hypothetical protein